MIMQMSEDGKDRRVSKIQLLLESWANYNDDLSRTMSVVTVQLGQCGNQIGTQLFSTLYDDATNPTSPPAYRQVALDRFFYRNEDTPGSRDLQARAVLVDMESKVVQHCLVDARKGGNWTYDQKCVYAEKRGSGNNWANGYLHHAPRAMTAILDQVRRQAECCDYLDGFLMLMSVAGGTGSGVGAKLTEYLHDTYPHATLVNPIVWPYSSGEVIVQDYNSLLTTAHLQSSCDAILLLQNQQFHKVCSQLLHLKEVALSDINKVISHSLASALQPAVPFDAHLPTHDNMMYGRCRLSTLASFLCPHAHFKFLSVKTIPQMPDSSHAYSRYMWAGLLKHLRQMLITDSATDEGMDWCLAPPTAPIAGGRGQHNINTSLANLLVLRGNELDSVETSALSDRGLYSKYSPASCTCSVWCADHAFNRYEKCCTVVSNSQSCVGPLERVCAKAWNMYSSRAYLHQYEKYGFTDEDFVSSFVAVEQILKDYKTIT